MKKLFVLILLLVGCAFQSQEERFVNPLFYETLYPISNHEVETRLTPNKIYTKSVIPERDCQLLKNAENEVEYSCMYEGPTAGYEPYLRYRYIITNKKYTQNCLVVEELFESGPAKGYSAYCIHLDE